MTLPVLETPIKFHLSLNATDIARSVVFYRVLFGIDPAKFHDDYAKFELDEPPVVFSLVPRSPGPGGALGRLGFCVGSESVVQAYRERLESAGIAVQISEGNLPGQNELTVRDPDGTLWQIGSRVEDDAAFGDPVAVAPREDAPAPSEDSWEHFITHPLPERIPHADASLDEVRLTGAFNGPIDEGQRLALVREARRVLRPGGRVLVHGLMADAVFPAAAPTLPGLAALVSRVPVQSEPADALRAAGFVDVLIVKLPEKAWFEHDGVGLREVKILARQPRLGVAETRKLVYRGPFREAVGDDGRVYARGCRVAVPLAVWEQLREGPAAGQFHFVGTECGN
jgi:catechol 2,3-dioxygenase-like lactoylglutathione lyase family enzyme